MTKYVILLLYSIPIEVATPYYMSEKAFTDEWWQTIGLGF